jgi:hypothetical protein
MFILEFGALRVRKGEILLEDSLKLSTTDF